MAHDIVVTQDGSHSLISEQFDVSYHSKYGAIGESQHVFIDAGLHFAIANKKKKDTIRVFEMGFGTGLNAFMTYLESEYKTIEIDYFTIEKFPLGLKLVSQLNYSTLLKASKEQNENFLKFHKSDTGICLSTSEEFHFTKLLGDVLHFSLPENIDVIYYDAFAPRSQPELWTLLLLAKLYTILNPSGILVTYCAQGAFKRALKEVGFYVENIPGPHGKREMTRAHKPN